MSKADYIKIYSETVVSARSVCEFCTSNIGFWAERWNRFNRNGKTNRERKHNINKPVEMPF